MTVMSTNQEVTVYVRGGRAMGYVTSGGHTTPLSKYARRWTSRESAQTWIDERGILPRDCYTVEPVE